MKHFISIIILFVLSTTATSQVIFSEDFNQIPGATEGGPGTYSFPPGWTLRNVDNQTPDASLSYFSNNSWIRREDHKFNVSDSVAFSTSWYSPTGTSDDWMWTPLIGTMPANAKLTWDAVAYDPDFADGYEVYVMTQSSAPAGPTGGPGNIGNQITSSTLVFSTASENTTWTSHTVNLSSFAGENIWIAFRNNSTDKFLLAIDNVIVEEIASFDAAVTAISPLSEYTMVPLPQVTSFPLQADIANNGSSSLTNVTLHVDVYNSSDAQVFSFTSLPTSVSGNTTTSLTTTTSFIPDVADTFNLIYYVTVDETDLFSQNDSLATSIIISDSTYARDNSITDGQIGISANISSGYLGQMFHLDASDTITSITMGFNGGYADETIAAVIFDMAGGTPNQIMGGTDTLTYTTLDPASYTLPISGRLILPPGDYLVAAVEFDSLLKLNRSNELFTPGTVWVSWPGQSWANIESLNTNFNFSLHIRPNFGTLPPCPATEVIVSVSANGESASSENIADSYQWINCDNMTLVEGAVTASFTASESGNYALMTTTGYCSDTSDCVYLTVCEEINTTISVSEDGETASSSVTADAFQWINCTDETEIEGATTHSYTATESGEYALIITIGMCSDTSECVTLTAGTTNSISDLEKINFSIYPNPASAYFEIVTNESADFTLLDMTGAEILHFSAQAQEKTQISVDQLSPGIYFIRPNSISEFSRKIIIR